MTEVNKDVLDIIDDVATTMSKIFKFGYYAEEDIFQEARLFALNGVNNYDATKGTKLKTFLITHVRNRLMSLKRDKFYRPPPKNMSPEQAERWEKRNGLKKSLAQPLNIDDVYGQDQSPVSFLTKKEVIQLIDKYLPAELRGDYRRMLDEMTIPKHRRMKVYNTIKNILEEHYGEIETWSPE